MFLTGHSWYGRWGDQKAAGRFLMIFGDPDKMGRCELRAWVRRIEMRQSGHYMVGFHELPDGHKLYVCGTYGNNGLPMDPPKDLWPRLHTIPQELQDAFWKGGGHNSAGKEGPDLRQWASDNIKALTHLKVLESNPAQMGVAVSSR